jgi:hypothetical protein
MKDNTRYIEGFARELGYKREGEFIFKFIEKSEQYKGTGSDKVDYGRKNEN